MGWFIFEIFVKIIAGILCIVVWPIALIVAGVKTLIDGIRYGYWHEDHWAEIPGIFRELIGEFKKSIYEW